MQQQIWVSVFKPCEAERGKNLDANMHGGANEKES